MLKFVIVGLILTTVGSAPLGSHVLEKLIEPHTQMELVRPSPINPDIPMDPKPPECIIFDDTVISDDNKSDCDKNPLEKSTSAEPHDDSQAELRQTSEPNSDNIEKTEAPKSSVKESIPSSKSAEPAIVYAVKAEEKQRSESFQTSHRIPNIEESERKFETSHHIPSHIDDERTKLIDNAKVGGLQPR